MLPLSVTAVGEGWDTGERKPAPREGVGDRQGSAAGAAITWEKRMVSGKIMTQRLWSGKLRPTEMPTLRDRAGRDMAGCSQEPLRKALA